MTTVPESLQTELARARRIAARADVDPAWVEGAATLAQQWADAEAAAHGWPPAPVRVPSVAALPDVLAAVARGVVAGQHTAPDADEVGDRLATDLAALRRRAGA